MENKINTVCTTLEINSDEWSEIVAKGGGGNSHDTI